ncbi:MAG: hypothetical protein IJP62_02535 [Treponema sp.]|nr:hypothetical protein [Treponema sp.]
MKKKRNLLLPLCISVSILYIILAARPLATELQFLPQWTIDASKVTVSKDSENLAERYEHAIPFKLGQTLGYFTADGDILSIVSFPYKAALSSSYYALYGTNDKKIPFFTPDGKKSGEISATGFPFFMESKQYLFLPGGSSFAKLDETGKMQWSYENYAPITAFSSSEYGCVAGYADGTVISFADDGKIDQTFSPGGSEYPVILGADLSNSGELIACVSGQNRQRFIVAKKSSNHTAIIHHEYLDTPTTRQVLVKFSKDESTVYFGSEDGLGIVDCTTGKSKHLKIGGHILSICESTESKSAYILSRNGETCTVHVIEPFATFAGSFSFKATSAFIATEHDNLFVGRNNTISKMQVTHR